MRVKLPAIAFLIALSEIAWSWEVIVCVPFELSYQPGANELTVLVRVEDEAPESFSGFLCNSSGSWCKEVSLKPNVETRLEVAGADISNTLIYYQTEPNAQDKYGGCEWPVSM